MPFVTLRFHIVSLLLSIVSTSFCAQSDRIKFEPLVPRQGIPIKTVSCILQDQRGFLWFGSDNGLYRYDGRTFVVYRNDRQHSNSISHNTIRALCEDRFGNLWVGTNEGLNKFDRNTEAFTRYLSDPKKPSGLIGSSVHTICEDRAGTLWIGSWGGLSRYDPTTDTFTHFRHDAGSPKSIGCDMVTTIVEDTLQSGRTPGIFWIGTGALETEDGGLNRFDQGSGTFKCYKHIPNDATSLSDNWVTAICRSRDGTLWVGTNGGLDRFDELSGKFTHYRRDQQKPGGIGSNHIRVIHEEASGTLWIGTWAGGLMKFDPASDAFVCYQNDPQNEKSLPSNSVLSVYRDRSGALWVGTAGGGVCRVETKPQPFMSYVHDDRIRGSLQNNAIATIIEDKSGMIWLGTATGLDVFDPATAVFTHYVPWEGPVTITGLTEDNSGTLWTGTIGGLNKVQREPYKRTPYVPPPKDLVAFVCSIHEDRNGILWMFTNYAGLCQFDPVKGEFVPMGLGKGLTEPVANLILEDRMDPVANSGGLWIGTNEGLARYDAETKAFERYVHDPKNPTSLASDLIRSLHIDAHGTLWVGTDRGLHRLQRENGKFELYVKKDLLPSDDVLGILEDSRGRLWLSTNDGITRFDPPTSQGSNYDAGDGLPPNQFNPGCCLRSSTGEMYFGGNKGLLRFHPDSLMDNAYVPPVVITGFKKSDELVSLDTAISEKRNISLSHEDNSFSFDFAALNYTRPENNQYAYKLEGYDKDWVYCGNQQYASYRNVEAGNYVFRVKGSNNDGLWNEEGTSIAVIVTPPFWGRWWFRVIVLVALFGSVGATIRFIERRKLKRENDRLEQERVLERERARISQDMHDEVGASLTEIAILSELAKKGVETSSEVHDRIDKISRKSREVIDNIGEIIWAINPKNDQLENLVAYLHRFAIQYFDSSPIVCRVEFPESIPAVQLPAESRRNIFLVCKEALHNVLKHSDATEVAVRIQPTQEGLAIVIRDNGKGFSVDCVSSFGNGLVNMKRRMEEIGGECRVESQESSGTTVTLTVNYQESGL